ncbi:Inactive phospholipase C-like protein 1 [Acipenser ruthenus]|uniref:Inactive phospholipase C-like protein 1 n=1 Tax=Acipenser ruthenus TaxID=7906 RepID=A0A444TXY4_ACIRT|nr:Inactive phospholipase C-like protein 1 [Acipenser ruthenus]
MSDNKYDGRCSDEESEPGPLCPTPGRSGRAGRRSGVTVPAADRSAADIEASLIEAAKATPRRSSIIKMIQEHRLLLETADSIHERITQVQKAAMEFHEDLHRLGAKEGLKGRKLHKAVENFAWNITVLKGQGDLLRSAKAEALDSLKQLELACLSCGLSQPEDGKARRGQKSIKERESGEGNRRI